MKIEINLRLINNTHKQQYAPKTNFNVNSLLVQILQTKLKAFKDDADRQKQAEQKSNRYHRIFSHCGSNSVC